MVLIAALNSKIFLFLLTNAPNIQSFEKKRKKKKNPNCLIKYFDKLRGVIKLQ